MSAAEFIAVALVLACALAFLARRAWLAMRGHGCRCGGQCPVAGRKIRLAAPRRAGSTPKA